MACKVKVNRHGFLAFRIYWNGHEFRQGTGWKNTPKNRIKAEGKAVEITDEINAGTFKYLRWFPEGNKAHEFGAKIQAKSVQNNEQTVRQFYEEWIEKNSRRSCELACDEIISRISKRTFSHSWGIYR